MEAIHRVVRVNGKNLGEIERSENGELKVLARAGLDEIEHNVFRLFSVVIVNAIRRDKPIPETKVIKEEVLCIAVPAMILGSYIGCWPDALLARLLKVPTAFVAHRRMLCAERRLFPVLGASEYGGGDC